jgi:hypothetical protein
VVDRRGRRRPRPARRPLMALVPVLRASRTTVRQAMDHHWRERGAAGRHRRRRRAHPGAAPVCAPGPRGAARPAQLRRRRTRFALLVGLLAVAGGLFVGGSGALAGWTPSRPSRSPSRAGTPRSRSAARPGRRRWPGWSRRCPGSPPWRLVGAAVSVAATGARRRSPPSTRTRATAPACSPRCPADHHAAASAGRRPWLSPGDTGRGRAQPR